MNEIGDGQNPNETASIGVYQAQESSKKIWIFIGIFVVLIVLAFIFLFIKFSSNTISEEGI